MYPIFSNLAILLIASLADTSTVSYADNPEIMYIVLIIFLKVKNRYTLQTLRLFTRVQYINFQFKIVPTFTTNVTTNYYSGIGVSYSHHFYRVQFTCLILQIRSMNLSHTCATSSTFCTSQTLKQYEDDQKNRYLM